MPLSHAVIYKVIASFFPKGDKAKYMVAAKREAKHKEMDLAWGQSEKKQKQLLLMFLCSIFVHFKKSPIYLV